MRPTVVFDGTCSLCSDRVPWLRRRSGDRLAYVAGESPEGRALLRPLGLERAFEDSIVFLGPAPYLRSAAVSRILMQLRFPWAAVGGLLWLVPLPLRDGVYRAIARRRHRYSL